MTFSESLSNSSEHEDHRPEKSEMHEYASDSSFSKKKKKKSAEKGKKSSGRKRRADLVDDDDAFDKV